MTTAKTDVFIFLLGWIDFWWEGIKIWWGGGKWANFLLLGDSPIPPVRKTPYKLCQQVFIYNEEAPCTSHTSCAKVAILLLQGWSTLCVAGIYGIYFHLSVHWVSTTINLSHHEHIQSGPMKEEVFLKKYLSLNIIKHTFPWRNKFVVYIDIYIYIGYP